MLTWLETAKNLAVGHTARVECPQCGIGTGATAAIVNHNPKHYSVHCYACDCNLFEQKGVLTLEERRRINELDNAAREQAHGRTISLPRDCTYEASDFSYEARMWLFRSGLTPTQWKKYRIGYSPYLQRVVLPVYKHNGDLAWYQLRAILPEQRPKYIQPSADRSSVVYAPHSERPVKRLILVEDIMSAIRLTEAITSYGNMHMRAASLLGTKLMSAQIGMLGETERVTTWLDPDRAGRRGAAAIRKSLSLIYEVDNIVTEEDPKCYSNKQIMETLNERTY